MREGRRDQIEAVVPYGNSNSLFHFRFDGDYRTFCGRVCDGWSPVETSVGTALHSAFLCKRCYESFHK